MTVLPGHPPIKDMRDGTHPAGCTYGGFSCGYWLIAEGCDLEHWEKHYVRDEECPCGNVFPGSAGESICYFNASDQDA